MTRSLEGEVVAVAPIDAYLHAGGPRFGSGSQALAEMDRFGIDKAVVVLPPSMPDFGALEEARELAGDRVRLVGIPVGEDERQREGLVEWQLGFGVLGLRLMPAELEGNRPGLERIGEAGRWLFFINPHEEEAVTRFLLNWLERHPRGRVVAPHFLRPGPIARHCPHADLLRDLLRHPRFHALFSRFGACGSTEAFPHRDLLPWVEEVLAETGWHRALWGSEYPVIHWREEDVPRTLEWLVRLMGPLPAEAHLAFFRENAQRLFFEDPAPEVSRRTGEPPAWAQGWVERGGFGPPVAQKGVPLSAETQRRLMTDYWAQPDRPKLGEFIARRLEQFYAKE